MINHDFNPNQRCINTNDLVSFAHELLIGAIGAGVRAISTQIQGQQIVWRCVFESEQAMLCYKPPLAQVEAKLRAYFYHHAELHGEYQVVSPHERMQHLNYKLFLRYEV